MIKQRFGFIDCIRGVAACLVMLQHSLYQSGLLGNWPAEKLTGFIPASPELGETGVVAFFLVSGFVIPLSLEKTADVRLFWVHRILRIYPLYIIIYLATLAIQAGGHLRSASALIFNVFASLLFIQEYVRAENFVGGSWTLSLEIVWYLAVTGLFVPALTKRINLIALLAILLSIAAEIFCIVGLHLPMERISLLMCCVLGMVCYRFGHGGITKNHFAVLAGGIIGIVAMNLLVGMYLFPSAHPTATFRMASSSWALAAVFFFGLFFTRESSLWTNPILSSFRTH